MALYKISDRYPNYQEVYFEGSDLKGRVLYSSERQEVGYVSELLVDESARLRYLVVDLNEQKRVLVPVRSCVKTTDEKSIYARELTLLEISQLEVYTESTGVDSSSAVSTASRQTVLQEKVTEPSASDLSIPLYEERLSTQKQRVKTGEVKISKRIVTETLETSTPIKREKIIIEIESIYGGDTRIDFDDAQVAEDGSISMGIYEERAEVCRQVVPYQNVAVRKEVVDDVVKTQQTLRREELAVNPEGLPYVDWADS